MYRYESELMSSLGAFLASLTIFSGMPPLQAVQLLKEVSDLERDAASQHDEAWNLLRAAQASRVLLESSGSPGASQSNPAWVIAVMKELHAQNRYDASWNTLHETRAVVGSCRRVVDAKEERMAVEERFSRRERELNAEIERLKTENGELETKNEELERQLDSLENENDNLHSELDERTCWEED